MELATGALGTLLPKLGKLLQEEYNLQKSVVPGIEGLKTELEYMQVVLLKVSKVPLDQLDPQVKLWANGVMKLSYVIEDILDSFMVQVEGIETTKPHPFMGFIKKASKKVTKFKAHHKIAGDMKYIESKVREVKDRYDRYNFHDFVTNHGATKEDHSRLSALYCEVSNLVGIDKELDMLIKRLSEGDDLSIKKLRTLSLVGLGGLGKTTLAKTIYDKINNEFTCGGFVSVGQNPDEKKVLRNILYELDKEKYAGITSLELDVRQLTDKLRAFLKAKRYLIVIDDIWDKSTWDAIKGAFVDNNLGSRIITTTRIQDVAERVGGIYDIKPLSDDNSKKLFFMRMSGAENTSSGIQSAEVSNKLLRKCGGVPLAIITMASLLVGKHRDEWSKVYDAIGFGDVSNEDVHNTRKILSYSYFDLPSHLKTCALYLSVYPEDYLIEKNSLIWRWVSEGFTSDKNGIGTFEIGEKYFNILLIRNIIRLIDSSDSHGKRNLVGCRVHDMVLDVIRTISSGVDFVVIQDKDQDTTDSDSSHTNSVRRIAVHGKIKHVLEKKHVRSYIAITCRGSSIPLLLEFKVLRVLVLEKCDFSEGCSLENLGKLVQLRYLGIVDTVVDELPERMGYDLKFLEVLDVRGGLIRELPASIGELTKLKCLCASYGTRMMGRVGKLTSLEELQLDSSVDRSPNFFTELGNLNKMRVLDIHFDEMDSSANKALAESLHKLPGIKCLYIQSHTEEMLHLDTGLEGWALPTKYVVREMCLSGILLQRRPSWMDSAHLPHLASLSFNLKVVEPKDMSILGKFPDLGHLRIGTEQDKLSYNVALSYSVDSGEFPKLVTLETTSMFITCTDGALPMLRQLKCAARVGKQNCFVRRSMPVIENIMYLLDCKDCSVEEAMYTEAAIWRVAEAHSNRPIVRIMRYDFEFLQSVIYFTSLFTELYLQFHQHTRGGFSTDPVYTSTVTSFLTELYRVTSTSNVPVHEGHSLVSRQSNKNSAGGSYQSPKTRGEIARPSVRRNGDISGMIDKLLECPALGKFVSNLAAFLGTGSPADLMSSLLGNTHI